MPSDEITPRFQKALLDILAEDLEDIRLLREAKTEAYGQPLVSLEEVKKELEDG